MFPCADGEAAPVQWTRMRLGIFGCGKPRRPRSRSSVAITLRVMSGTLDSRKRSRTPQCLATRHAHHAERDGSPCCGFAAFSTPSIVRQRLFVSLDRRARHALDGEVFHKARVARFAHALPQRGFAHEREDARPISSAYPGATSKPVSPGHDDLQRPARAVAITGLPTDMASMSTSPNGSRGLGKTNRSAALISASVSLRKPSSLTVFPSPPIAICESQTRLFASPAPAITQTAAGSDGGHDFHGGDSVSKLFSRSSRATATISVAPGSRPSSARMVPPAKPAAPAPAAACRWARRRSSPPSPLLARASRLWPLPRWR